MNPFDDPARTEDAPENLANGDLAHDDARFDRLVDGELSGAERRRLLAALDDEPGGWRRCALAFLEAQAWRESLPDLRQQAGVAGLDAERGASAGRRHTPAFTTTETANNMTATIAAATRVTLRPGSNPSRRLPLALAMAASFLVAFVLGSESRRRFSAGPEPAAQLTRQPSPTAATTAAATEWSVQDTPGAIVDEAPPSPIIPWGEATFVTDGSEGREVEVPVFDLDPAARQVLLESSTAALDELRNQLQRSGYDVRRTVRWSPVPIGDDRHMLIPVGDFEISLASHRPIQ